MPQNDAVSKALSSAKSALAHSNMAFPAAKPAPAKPTPAPASKPTPTISDELKAKQDNVNQYMNAPKMHNGGPVAADGVYQLKKGEHVLTAPEAAKARKHAMMAVGMKSLAKENPKATALSTTKAPEKKSTHGVTVKNQVAKVKGK